MHCNNINYNRIYIAPYESVHITYTHKHTILMVIFFRWTHLSQFPVSPSDWATGRASGLYKMLGVGLLVVTIWWELCMSFSSSCHHHHLHYLYNPEWRHFGTNPGPVGKTAVKMETEPSLASWLTSFSSPFIPRLCILLGQVETLHNAPWHVQTKSFLANRLSSSINHHHHTAFHPTGTILYMSKTP